MVVIFKGVLIIILIKILSSILDLYTVGLLLEYVLSWGPIALIVIFQPQIRNVLESIGRERLTRSASCENSNGAFGVEKGYVLLCDITNVLIEKRCFYIYLSSHFSFDYIKYCFPHLLYYRWFVFPIYRSYQP